MTTIWLASSGDYSDYSVSCAFTTLDLALAYVASLNKLPVNVQRQLYDIDSTPYSATASRIRHDLETAIRRDHPDANWGWFVEKRELFDAVPIAQPLTSSDR